MQIDLWDQTVLGKQMRVRKAAVWDDFGYVQITTIWTSGLLQLLIHNTAISSWTTNNCFTSGALLELHTSFFLAIIAFPVHPLIKMLKREDVFAIFQLDKSVAWITVIKQFLLIVLTRRRTKQQITPAGLPDALAKVASFPKSLTHHWTHWRIS